ncbi:hypothetical protein LWI29_038312 [Acer saccharum]|uniref:Putative plant transposon protein domain-containing protein n=1 Tax=Acer saccharum TaxID=4024 RepID=A0AA39VLJ5_ACESA|nr:hypothetical protein LWI29_038312 [Acer saccharum]
MSGRTRQFAKQVGQGSERRTRRALQVPPCVRHTNFEDRMEYFKWHDIVMERGITVKVVEEFYSGMVPEYFQQHSSVMVRGVEVLMTIADINKYYRIEILDDQQVAPDYRMKHTNLRLDLSFWLVFISLSLTPRKHKTSVNFNATTVLHDQLIDVGFFIKREILELGCIRVDKQPFIFPSLITAFCKEVGVDFGSDLF